MASKSNNHGKVGQVKDGQGKVGSDVDAARNFGGKNDFGAAERDIHEREYVSENTKRSDPGSLHPHAGTDGDRTSGVGGTDSGSGSSSGGDLDTDLVTIGGVSQSGPDERTEGPDMISGDPRPGASEKSNPDQKHAPPRRQIVHGSTVDHSGGDISTTGAGQAAGAVTNPARNDDSFAGEINDAEAGGIDNSPSDSQP